VLFFLFLAFLVLTIVPFFAILFTGRYPRSLFGFNLGALRWAWPSARVALLFTTRYPRGIFDLVAGLNRWVFRVIAYAALMTDVYPPFRLDQGGLEPRPSTASLR
jgi:Domain of unknown function (DUF4389)